MLQKISEFAKKNKTYLIVASNFILFAAIIFIVFGRAIQSPNHLYIGIEGDSSYYIWITKWFSQFFSHPDILHVTNVFYPIGIDISAGWEGSILFYVGGFFNLFFSESAAYNLLILFPLFLDWVALYYVFKKFSNKLFFSGIFATLFCTSTFFMARSLGHPSYLYFFHIPLLFYFLQYDWLKNINLKKSLLLIAIYVLISITSWYYFIFAIIITAIYLISFTLKNDKSDFKIYKKIALTYAGVLIAVVVFNFPMFKAFLFGSDYFYPYPFKMNNTQLNQQLSMNATDYLRPSSLNNFYSNHPAWVFGNAEKNLFPGISFFILLAISIFYILKRKKYKEYAGLVIVALLFFIISLGYNSPLPLYRWLNSLPIASTLHAPPRFGIVVILIGWIIIAKGSKYIKGFGMAAILFCLVFFQLYESSFFNIPMADFNNLSILRNLKTNEKSPVLELPLRLNISETLLIPALSGRPVFSGYPQHTTYSPQLESIADNNVLNYLDETDKNKQDITEMLSPEETAYYLLEKFGLDSIVVNKNLSLNERSKELLGFFELTTQNENYSIYKLNKSTLPEKINDVKLITGVGVGKLMDKKRRLAEKSQIDVLNLTGETQKIKLNFDLHPFDEGGEYSIDGKKITPDFEMVSQPGIGTFTITSNKKCTVSGADCVTGSISEINLEASK